jgi:predicted nucleic acid-binding protein
MQRIAPILQANIQEHSIMKYQEQMNGITEQMMQGVNPEEAQNPAVVEMVMAQAAQQILNANQAMGQAQSPEQQLVSLEQAKVELEKQKLESDTMVQAAEMELKTKKLKLEEADQIIDLLKTNATNSMKEEKAELDRDAKERLKELDIEGKLDLEDFKVTAENEREVARTIKDMLEARMKDDKDMEEKALEALTQLAVSQRENDYDD